MKRTTFVCALFALAFAFGTAQAQPTAGAQPKLAHADRKFIDNAVQGGMFEVQVSQLAASKATDPQVKSFAGMLLDQHTAANNDLVKIANAKGVELPAVPGHGKRRAIDRLGQRQGADFDEHFVREVGIKDHEKNIEMFQKAGKNVKDADLRAFIDKTLPSLRDHLALAQKLPQAGKKSS